MGSHSRIASVYISFWKPRNRTTLLQKIWDSPCRMVPSGLGRRSFSKVSAVRCKMRPLIYSVKRKRGSSLENVCLPIKLHNVTSQKTTKFNFMFVRKVANKNYRIEGRESMHSDSKLKEIRSVILSVNCMYAYCISWTIYTHIMTSISIKELMSLRVTIEHVM